MRGASAVLAEAFISGTFCRSADERRHCQINPASFDRRFRPSGGIYAFQIVAVTDELPEREHLSRIRVSSRNMRMIVAIVICLAALYVADFYWLGGMYFDAVRGIAMQI
jgi:hypothetical protein